MKISKKRKAALEKIDVERVYSPKEAIELAKETASAKFDETVEVHIRMGVDPRQADQQVRGTVVLPHGTGKTVRVVVFAEGEKAKEAEEAGADEVGGDELIEKVQKGWLEFDAAIATPDMMGKVGKLGKLLGPRGLMPNPKTGTVTFEVGKAVGDTKGGKVEYRVDKFAIMHLVIGKASFEVRQLVENYETLLEEIIRAKPSAAKGKYLKTISFSTTMGPGINVDTQKSKDLMEETAGA
jgi:large subunit ribosomal protein L1